MEKNTMSKTKKIIRTINQLATMASQLQVMASVDYDTTNDQILSNLDDIQYMVDKLRPLLKK